MKSVHQTPRGNGGGGGGGGAGGGGMSRAAKRRAKKKKNGQPESTAERHQSMAKSGDRLNEPHTKKRKVSDSTSAIRVPSGSKNSEDIAASPKDIQLLDILLLRPTDALDQHVQHDIRDLTFHERARRLFETIIYPTPVKEFFEEYWEKKPLFVPAIDNEHRYDGFLSLKIIQEMTKKVPLYYGRDLNVTRYQKDSDGVKRRITLDKTSEDEQEMRTGVVVDPSELWSNYEERGCTVRLLCPQKHNDKIHSLLSTLESQFGCMVGANAYLTPPHSSQGFAPHWDDIEAFCLQLEGSKRWKVYEPTFELPRVSSEDFTAQDLKEKEPILEVTAGPGDLLYMPRGWIHEARTLKESDEHSLHLTVSVMQQWAWIDLLEMVMPNALEACARDEDSSDLREGLPRGFLDYMGAMHDSSVDENLPDKIKESQDDEEGKAPKMRHKIDQQEEFREQAKKKIMQVAMKACEMVDAACDQMGKRYLADRLPPALTAKERAGTNVDVIEGTSEKDILPASLCRLTRPGVARLVLEDDKAVIYHCMDNSRVYQENPLSPLEFETDDGPALEQLLTTVEPNWIRVNDLYHDTIEDKVAIAQSLYDEGILCVRSSDEDP